MSLAGMVSLRWREVEENHLAIVPGTSTEHCHRCSEKIAVSPAMYRLLDHRHPQLWCWECFWEIHPEGANFAATREMILEALLLHRLERDMRGGPIH